MTVQSDPGKAEYNLNLVNEDCIWIGWIECNSFTPYDWKCCSIFIACSNTVSELFEPYLTQCNAVVLEAEDPKVRSMYDLTFATS
jgi:hypothetical protein